MCRDWNSHFLLEWERIKGKQARNVSKWLGMHRVRARSLSLSLSLPICFRENVSSVAAASTFPRLEKKKRKCPCHFTYRANSIVLFISLIISVIDRASKKSMSAHLCGLDEEKFQRARYPIPRRSTWFLPAVSVARIVSLLLPSRLDQITQSKPDVFPTYFSWTELRTKMFSKDEYTKKRTRRNEREKTLCVFL